MAFAARDHAGVSARYFHKQGKRLDMARLEPALIDALLRHDYSHHVRELNQLLWVALTSGRRSYVELTAALRAELASKQEQLRGSNDTSQDRAEREAIKAALAQTRGKIAPAAQLLGLKNRHALYRMLARHGIRSDDDPEGGG